jgi:hypothetical protein
VNLYHFLKKHYNHCTLLYSEQCIVQKNCTQTLAFSALEATSFSRKFTSLFIIFLFFIFFTLVFHFMLNPDPDPVPEPESGSAKAKCCRSGSTVPQHCSGTCLIRAFLLYSGAGHTVVGEARLLRHGGHGGARLPPLGLSQAAVCGHAHHYRLHQVHACPLWDSARQQFVGMLTITDFIR